MDKANATLIITAQAMREIDVAVRAADFDECMGLLASAPGDETITGVEILAAQATSAHAEASPLEVKRAADAMAARALVPRGIWHSHGRHDVFHSGTDIATIHRLLPAMAMQSYRRDTSTLAPTVEGPDTAVLPLADGRLMLFTLTLEPIPGTDLSERATWARVSVDYPRTVPAPVAELTATSLWLASAGVAVSLGVPAGARVEQRIVDRATMRRARLFSLVVNTRRERYAQCLAVTDVAGEMTTALMDCEVEVVGGDAGERHPSVGPGEPRWLERPVRA